MAKLRVTHIIAGLGTGGAEMMLLKLVRETRGEVSHYVISLTDLGTLGRRMTAEGATVVALGLRSPLHLLFALPRLASELARSNPELVHGWMYHGNIAATTIALLTRPSWPVAWAIRCTIGTLKEKVLTQMLVRAGALLSRQPDAIFYNSALAMVEHEAIGYAPNGFVMPNGFEMDKFAPDSQARRTLRELIGAATEQPVVGYVGRLAPIKDLPTFFAAMAQVASTRPDVKVVAIGRDLPRTTEALPESKTVIDFLGENLILLPEQENVEAWYQAFDVSVLSSLAEGFPNVIGEAMASGKPCVSTDVGNTAEIIADTGRVVPVRAPAAMAAAVLEIIGMEGPARAALGERARERVSKHYAIGVVAVAHLRAWRQLVKGN